MVLLGWGVGWASVVWVWVVMWMAPYQSCLRPVGPHLLQFRRCLYVQENRGRQQTAGGSGRVRRTHRPRCHGHNEAATRGGWRLHLIAGRTNK